MKSHYLNLSGILVLLTMLVPTAIAQENFVTAGIARMYDIADDSVETGDIIVYDKQTDTYRRSLKGDRGFVGIVVESPLIVFQTLDSGASVIGEGEVVVNVSNLNGPIEIGDFIGVSSLPGKGQRVEYGSPIVGVARSAFDEVLAESSLAFEGTSVALGRIVVSLDLGAIGVSDANMNTSELLRNEIAIGEAGETATTSAGIFKYVMAAFIAVGSLYVSFKNFGANIRSSVISVGRNPLAKRSIQAMVILNVMLILLVGGGGIFLSLAILLLPF